VIVHFPIFFVDWGLLLGSVIGIEFFETSRLEPLLVGLVLESVIGMEFFGTSRLPSNNQSVGVEQRVLYAGGTIDLGGPIIVLDSFTLLEFYDRTLIIFYGITMIRLEQRYWFRSCTELESC
jgi:hypothetical protein